MKKSVLSCAQNLHVCLTVIILTFFTFYNQVSIASPSIDLKVTGTITDANNNPLDGVSVMLKGTNKGVLTDVSGRFTIVVAGKESVLIISGTGYQTQEVAVGEKTNLVITLRIEGTQLTDVIVVGYGTQKKKDITGAVSTLKAERIAQLPVTSLSNALGGRFSGVYVSQNTGVPGISASLRIRAGGSWNISSPLYVIDGIILDKASFDRLDPSEIADFTILKDASAAAIYGSRSSGGVVLVTTKRGKEGKPVIQYFGSYSFDKPTSFPEIMDPVSEGIPFVNNAFPDPAYWAHWSDAEAEALIAQGGWKSQLDHVYRTPNINRHTLNVTGGNDKIKFFIGGSYAKEVGFLPNLDYDKYTLRGNIEAKISNSLTAFLQLNTNYDKRSKYNWNGDEFRTNAGLHDLNNLWGWLIAAYGYIPAYIDGLPTDNGWNGNLPERFHQGYQHFSGQGLDALASLKYDVPFVKGLSAKLIFSKNNNYGYNKRFDKNIVVYQFKPLAGSRILSNTVIGSRNSSDPGLEYLQNEWNRQNSYQLNGQINYTRNFRDHQIDALFVYEQSEWTIDSMSGKRKNFPVVAIDQFWATSTDSRNFELNGNENQGARLSYVGRLNYAYSDRYLLSASIRRDGSVLFSPNKRWGYFPAVSAGWIITNENFLKDKIRSLDFFKMRASYGVTGNDLVGGWQWQNQYYLNNTYILGGQPFRGITTGGITNGRYYNVSNPGLTWEKSATYNFGFDSRWFNVLDINFEYWFRRTTDILGGRNASFPAESGIYPSDENYGKVNSKGVEIELAYENSISKDLRYFIRANFAYATNTVVLQDVAQNAQDVDNPNGKTLGYIKGLKNAGILRSEADLGKLPTGYTINGYLPQPGMLNYVDLSGPGGAPDGKIDTYDNTVIARYSAPPYAAGLTLGGDFKGLTLELFFQGNFGGHKLYDDAMCFRQADTYDMPWKHWLDSWTPSNPNGKYPQQLEQWGGVQPSDVKDSDFWLINTSFMRLKNVTVGYTLPRSLTQKAGIENLRLYVIGTNLLTFAKDKLYDPELASYSSYPIMRTYTFGINLSL